MKPALLFLYVLMMSSLALPQWTRTSGPEGVSISCLVNIGNTIYAGTQVDGLYASTDDGMNWSPLNAGIETVGVSSVVGQSEYLFVGTQGRGVYRSADGGQTWTAPSTGGNLFVVAMVVKDSFIFAGTGSDGVYRSSDDGETWTQKLSGFVGVMAMCVSGNTIYASTYGYTYASSDNGENWFLIDDLEGAAPFSLYCKDSLFIAGCVNEIYKSTDYGNSFQTINLNIPYSIVNVYDIAAIGPALFAATSYDGVYKSMDGGLTWTPANNGMGPKDARALTVSESSTLIAGTHYVGVYRSTDMASQWNKSLAGFAAGSSIESMLAAESYIFAGTRDGIYRTADNAKTWIKVGGTNDTINYCSVRGLCQLNGVIYAGTRLQFHATVYKSFDDGETWTRSGNGFPNDLTFVNGLATVGSNIVVATDDGIYYSSDEGGNWHPTNITNKYIPAIASGGGYGYAIVPGYGIYRSVDNGVSWILSLGSTLDYVEVAAGEYTAFAGTFFTGARYSTNNGSSWSVSGGFPSDASIFALAPVGDGIVLAGTDLSPTWIYASFDNGVTYSPYSGGLGEQAATESFAASDSFMFAGTDYNGVWRRLRSGLVGINERPSISRTFQLDQNFPNPFNPTTTIHYTLPEATKVSLKIYDVLGREIRTLVNQTQLAGTRSVVWDGKNNHGKVIGSGIYFYRLQSKSKVLTRKMIFLK